MKKRHLCKRRLFWLLPIPVLLFFNACTGIGPPTVARDRFDYVNAISESWKQQMLINLVKIRYLDAPQFLDVASVINQYSLEGEIALGASWSSDVLVGNSQTVGGTGRYSDRPTITYSPLTGERFTQRLMTPIPVVAILAMLQILIELASHINVPPEDVAEGRVYEAPEMPTPGFPDLINIHSGSKRPADAYAAVRYRDMWFWIDDRDLNSKRMFSFSMLLFSLTETGRQEGVPIVTVPTN